MRALSVDRSAGNPNEPNERADSSPVSRPRWGLLFVAVAILAAGVWIGAVILSLGRGFDTSDEGLYLLSYRWWDTEFTTFTGAQFIYGPVFHLLGENIMFLRAFRLVTVVGVQAVFGWVFMRWLRQRRPATPSTRLWEVAGTATIVAAGGMAYSWIPLSPGYNDLSMLGALLAGATVLRMATHVDRASPVRAWLPAALGPVAVVVLLARWPSAVVTFAVVGTAAVVVLAPLGFRQVLRAIACAIAGAVITLLLIQVLLVPLTVAIPELISTTRNASADGLSIPTILLSYGKTTFAIAKAAARAHGLLLVAAVVAALARSPRNRIIAGALTVVGLGVSAYHIVADGNLRGGATNVASFPTGLLALAGITMVLGLVVALDRRPGAGGDSSLRRDGRRGLVLLAMVALLPATQAFGTNNALYEVAILGFAAWVAVMIAVLTGIESAPGIARSLTAVAAGAAVLVSVAISVNATWFHPYRVGPRASNTATATGVPALDSVALEPAVARRWTTLREQLGPYVEPGGRAIMAFDEMPGVVFLLGGRSVGEQWYAADNPQRTARGIRAVCEAGRAWWGPRSPILIFRRPVSEIEVSALRSCGLSLETDYRLLPARAELVGFTVYVPIAG